jgi:amino acid transporter
LTRRFSTTSIIGSNGVLNRVAEDGVLPRFFRLPHPKFGTTNRIINLIVGLQLLTIVISRGDVTLQGEAYAFGVVWSFAMKALAVIVLRFKQPAARAWKVPFNVRIGTIEAELCASAGAGLRGEA